MKKLKEKKIISIILTGGGTGGHIYPALAVAEVLKKDPKIFGISYIGCGKNLEKDIVTGEGIDFHSINVSGMPRKFGLKLLTWLTELLTATVKSHSLLLELKPDVVFGTGGYVTAPVLIAALLLKIPYVIHDPDAHPGIVNKFMAKGAKCVSLAFEQAKDFIKTPNTVVYGNPVRGCLAAVSKEEAISELGLDSERKTALAIGGSQGAKSINDAMMDAIPILVNKYGFQIIHQTGRKNFDEYTEKFYAKYPDFKGNPGYIVKPYFDNISLPLNAADVAISRAGSLSISELNLCGLPSILIPYPYAAADHQRFNALAMENTGAAICLEDDYCNSGRIIELIDYILENPEKMKRANKILAKPDSAENIVKELKSVAIK